MDDKTHVAKYSCPNGYEVVYTGEGTKVCDGACFRKGSSQSLRQAVEHLVQTKWGRDYFLASDEYSKVSEDLLTTGKASLTSSKKGTLEFRAPRGRDE
jgi:hypothetical protein